MRPGSPNRVKATGWLGDRTERTQHVVGDGLAVADQRLHQTPVGRSVGIRGRPPSRRASGMQPPRRSPRWAGRTAPVVGRGRREARRRPAGGRRGTPAPSGWTAEHTSWRKPGTVRSSVRHPPPARSAPSTTVTDSPAAASVTAADNPLGPDPTTTTSTGFTVGSRRYRGCSSMKFYRPRCRGRTSGVGAPATATPGGRTTPMSTASSGSAAPRAGAGRGTAIPALYPSRVGGSGSGSFRRREPGQAR